MGQTSQPSQSKLKENSQALHPRHLKIISRFSPKKKGSNQPRPHHTQKLESRGAKPSSRVLSFLGSHISPDIVLQESRRATSSYFVPSFFLSV